MNTAIAALGAITVALVAGATALLVWGDGVAAVSCAVAAYVVAIIVTLALAGMVASTGKAVRAQEAQATDG